MPQIVLTPSERKAHRAAAHALNPVVLIGAAGLTDAVLRETDAALNAHGLIKIRMTEDDRSVREQALQSMAEQLDAAPIQHIGKLLVLWRPQPEKTKAVDEKRKPGPREVKIVKYSKRGGQRPEVRMVRVLGNERITPTGKVKRARIRQVSSKKQQLD